MVVDTSAIIAVLRQEADAARFAQAIESVERPLVSAATVIEAAIVMIARGGPSGRANLSDFLATGGFQVEPVTAAQTEIAIDAFERFGKGRGKGANLNYGDCFSYALAKSVGQPLLFKGNDFSLTDVEVA